MSEMKVELTITLSQDVKNRDFIVEKIEKVLFQYNIQDGLSAKNDVAFVTGIKAKEV